ncbi:MAG: FAD-binding oxidoreductase [Alphaproteobacteria bacterium]|nr:FAD-binding oxidoreductase [Alphaproteobacteria bacterium]
MTIIAVDDQGFKQSLWTATGGDAPDCPPLQQDKQTDIAIVGGGFTGLSTALHLAERGVSVVLLEAYQPGWGASGRNGGQVIAGLKHDLAELERLVGPDMARRMIGFADKTADTAFGIIDRLKLDCDAVRGGWIQSSHGVGVLEEQKKKAEKMAARGRAVSILSKEEMIERVGTDWYVGGLLDAAGGTVQPLKLARGLARAAQSAGAQIHGETPVTNLSKGKQGWVLTAANGMTVTAAKVLLCTNGYSDLTPLQNATTRSVVPFYSYQMATAPLSDNLLKSLPAQGLGVSEARRVLSYYRIDSQGRFIMGARGKLNGSLDQSAFDLARQRMKEMYPRLDSVPMESFWNGRVAVTTDSLPRLMQIAPGLGAAVGWNGRGVAMTTSMGSVLADWLTDVPQQDLPMPIGTPRPIPFHWLKRPAAGIAVQWKSFLDKRERKL